MDREDEVESLRARLEEGALAPQPPGTIPAPVTNSFFPFAFYKKNHNPEGVHVPRGAFSYLGAFSYSGGAFSYLGALLVIWGHF